MSAQLGLASSEPAAVLCVDPPWRAKDQLPGERGASHKYATMSTDEICALTLPARAERHVLFLWRLASMTPDAARVLDAWGYIACAELVWCKLRPCPVCCATGRVDAFRMSIAIVGQELLFVPGSDRRCPTCHGARGIPYMGLGHYTRGAHEVAIIARPKRGRAPERLDLGVSSVFSAPMLIDVDGLLATSCACGHEKDEHADRGGCFARDAEDPPLSCRCLGFGPRRGSLVHSAKPDAFFAIVERMYAGPRVELFSRRTRPGWTSTASDQDGRLDEVARVMRDVWPARERAARLARARRQS